MPRNRGYQWNRPGFQYQSCANPAYETGCHCLSQARRIWHSPKTEQGFLFLNAPMTILRSGELCDQLLRDLIAKEATKGLGIFCYLASLFSSGSVAVSGLW